MKNIKKGEIRRGNERINYTIINPESETYEVYYHHITSGAPCESITQVTSGICLSEKEDAEFIEFLEELEEDDNLEAWLDFEDTDTYAIINY